MTSCNFLQRRLKDNKRQLDKKKVYVSSENILYSGRLSMINVHVLAKMYVSLLSNSPLNPDYDKGRMNLLAEKT